MRTNASRKIFCHHFKAQGIAIGIISRASPFPSPCTSHSPVRPTSRSCFWTRELDRIAWEKHFSKSTCLLIRSGFRGAGQPRSPKLNKQPVLWCNVQLRPGEVLGCAWHNHEVWVGSSPPFMCWGWSGEKAQGGSYPTTSRIRSLD